MAADADVCEIPEPYREMVLDLAVVELYENQGYDMSARRKRLEAYFLEARGELSDHASSAYSVIEDGSLLDHV